MTLEGLNLHNTHSITINSEKRTSGYSENFTISLTEPVKRVRKVFITDVQIPYTINNFIRGNNRLLYRPAITANISPKPNELKELHLFPSRYSMDELAEELTNVYSEVWESYNYVDPVISGATFNIIASLWTWKWTYNSLTNQFEAKGLGEQGSNTGTDEEKRKWWPSLTEIVDNPSGYNIDSGAVDRNYYSDFNKSIGIDNSINITTTDSLGEKSFTVANKIYEAFVNVIGLNNKFCIIENDSGNVVPTIPAQVKGLEHISVTIAPASVSNGHELAIVLQSALNSELGLKTDVDALMLSITQNTSGAADNTYPNVATSGGGGTGAALTVEIVGGVVASVTVTNHGENYASGNTLTVAAAVIGNGGNLIFTLVADDINNAFNVSYRTNEDKFRIRSNLFFKITDGTDGVFGFSTTHETDDPVTPETLVLDVKSDLSLDVSGSSKTRTIDGTNNTFKIQNKNNIFVDNTFVNITASDGVKGDDFGRTISISNDIIAIGSHRANSDKGAVYIYTTTDSGLTWSNEVKLTDSSGISGDEFGKSVSLDGNYIVIGVPQRESSNIGKAITYRTADNGVTWSDKNTILASNGLAFHYFGTCVSLSGNYVASSSPAGVNSDKGAVYMYRTTNSGLTWSGEVELNGSDSLPEEGFGTFVSISGDNVVISSDTIRTNGQLSGGAYIFNTSDNGVTWNEITKIYSNDIEPYDRFGGKSHMYNNFIIVGAWNENTSNLFDGKGAAYIFEKDKGGINNWGQVAKLTSKERVFNDHVGVSVYINDKFAITANDRSTLNVFKTDDNGTTWDNKESVLFNSNDYNFNIYYNEIALSNKYTAVGLNYNSSLPNPSTASEIIGSVNVYSNIATLTLSSVTDGTVDQLATILETAFNKSLIGPDWTVEYERPRSTFLILRNGLAPDGYNFRGGTSMTSQNTSLESLYGFFTSSHGDVRPLLRDTYNHSLERVIEAGSYDFNLNLYTATLEIAVGTYTPTKLATHLTSLIAINSIVSTRTVTFDEVDNGFLIDKDTSEDYRILTSNEGASKALGYDFINDKFPTVTLGNYGTISTIKINLKRVSYIYIKSNTIVKYTNRQVGSDLAYRDVLYKLDLRNIGFGDFIHSTDQTFIHTLAFKSIIDELDFRLEDENNGLIDLNGREWSFSFILETY